MPSTTLRDELRDELSSDQDTRVTCGTCIWLLTLDPDARRVWMEYLDDASYNAGSLFRAIKRRKGSATQSSIENHRRRKHDLRRSLA